MKVALTYDDGPDERWTPRILDALAEHDALATFFVVGQHASGLLARTRDEGHLIGNHTHTHPHLPSCNLTETMHELRACNEAIERETGETPTMWRAPYGELGELAEGIAESLGLRHVGWTVNPGDWNCLDADTIAERVLDWLHDGAIVDLHDGMPPSGGSGTDTRQPTVDATRLILENAPDVIWVRVDQL